MWLALFKIAKVTKHRIDLHKEKKKKTIERMERERDSIKLRC